MAKQTNAAASTPAKTETAEGEVKKKKGGLYVTKEFHDKNNFDQIYKVGQDVSETFPAGDRRDELIGHGVVEVHGEEAKVETDPNKDSDPNKDQNPPA